MNVHSCEISGIFAEPAQMADAAEAHASFYQSLGLPVSEHTSAAAALASLHQLALDLGVVKDDVVESDGMGDLDEEIELEAGATREATRSPAHVRLRLDNFVDDEGCISEDEDAEWVNVARGPPASSSLFAPVAASAEGDPFEGDELPEMPPAAGGGSVDALATRLRSQLRSIVTDEPAAHVAGSDEAVEASKAALAVETATRALLPSFIVSGFCSKVEYERWVAAVCASLPEGDPQSDEPDDVAVWGAAQGCDGICAAELGRRTGEVAKAPVAADGEAEAEAVMPFLMDPDFDYDRAPLTPAFSLQRAAAEGEFYDAS